MNKLIEIALEIGLLSFLAMLYYFYQKRKIGYYIAKEFELLRLNLLESINANIKDIENAGDTQKLSDYCRALEDGSINVSELNNIKKIFHTDEDIQIVADQLIDIITDKPLPKS